MVLTIFDSMNIYNISYSFYNKGRCNIWKNNIDLRKGEIWDCKIIPLNL